MKKERLMELAGVALNEGIATIKDIVEMIITNAFRRTMPGGKKDKKIINENINIALRDVIGKLEEKGYDIDLSGGEMTEGYEEDSLISISVKDRKKLKELVGDWLMLIDKHGETYTPEEKAFAERMYKRL